MNLDLLPKVVTITTIVHSVLGSGWLCFTADFAEIKRDHLALLVVSSFVQVAFVLIWHISVLIERLDRDLDLTILVVNLL